MLFRQGERGNLKDSLLNKPYLIKTTRVGVKLVPNQLNHFGAIAAFFQDWANFRWEGVKNRF